MQNAQRKISYTPVTDSLSEEGVLIDNEFDIACQSLKVFSKLNQFGFQKRHGYYMKQILFIVLIWPLLRSSSLYFFCGNRLSAYFSGGKDVLYEFLKRQNFNWRGLRLEVAHQLIRQHNLQNEKTLALVVDDTIKHRRGRKVAATSSHFDHTLGKKVMGQQVLEAGLATQKGYAPLDSQIYVSKKKVLDAKVSFKDKRSAVARDYEVAKKDNKNEMFRQMLKRIIRKGIPLTHVVADSWFGNKENIKSVLNAELTAIFRMKRGNIKFRINEKDYCIVEIYALVRRKMKKVKNSKYRNCTLNVQLNLSTQLGKEDWVNVKLLFSAPSNQNGKDQWAVFLSTDTQLSATEILEIYALRWGIEVYFKEIKQHLGFLKEQSGDYAVHYASIHLCAIRYMLIADRMMTSGTAFGKMRNRITGQLEMLTFARLLWELFKALIHGALHSLKNVISNDTIDLIKNKICQTISEFLDNALQLDKAYLDSEKKALAMCEL